MVTNPHNARVGVRPLGLGPWLMLAVTMIVLTSGGVSTARLIGSAGVGLAMTVLPERAGQPTDTELHSGTVFPARFADERGTRSGTDRMSGGDRAWLMARLGELDLPPPSLS